MTLKDYQELRKLLREAYGDDVIIVHKLADTSDYIFTSPYNPKQTREILKRLAARIF